MLGQRVVDMTLAGPGADVTLEEHPPPLSTFEIATEEGVSVHTTVGLRAASNHREINEAAREES